jgi:hypothetical protein
LPQEDGSAAAKEVKRYRKKQGAYQPKVGEFAAKCGNLRNQILESLQQNTVNVASKCGKR